MDDDGTITTITHEDGSHWDYDYDGRNRSIAADRKSASGNIVAKYAKKIPLDTLSEYRKAYLAARGDNVLTKTERRADDFARDCGYPYLYQSPLAPL